MVLRVFKHFQSFLIELYKTCFKSENFTAFTCITAFPNLLE